MTDFTLATFNMQFGQLWDPESPDSAPVDIAATIRFLRTLDADILCLQEVEKVPTPNKPVHPPPHYTRLCEELSGYESFFSYPKADPDELPFGFGLAIFSKYPLCNLQAIDLPSAEVAFEFEGKTHRTTQRLLLSATVTINGRKVRILNTHLQAYFMLKTDSNLHRAQRDAVEQLLRNESGCTVLAGDMNSAPGESLVEQFRNCGYETAQAERTTWKRRDYVLDHIFFNSSLLLREPVKIVPTTTADHHLLMATFGFSKDS